MMKQSKTWFFLWILIPILAAGLLLFFSVSHLLDPALYGRMLQDAIGKEIGREVTIGKMKVNLWGGLGIAFEDVRVKDLSGAFDLLQARKLIATVMLRPLLRKEVKWREIVLDSPRLRLVRDKQGRFNFTESSLTPEALKASQQRLFRTLATLFGGSFTVRNGSLHFSDEFIGATSVITELRALNLNLTRVSYEKPFPFLLNGKVLHSNREGKFSFTGRISDIPEDMDFSRGSIESEIETRGIDLSHFWPYLRNRLPMKVVAGVFDLDGSYRGGFSGRFKSAARIRFQNVIYDHPQVFAQTFLLKRVHLDFQVDSQTTEFNIPYVTVELPEVRVKAKGRFYGIGTKEMGMEAEARTESFDLSDGKRYIPYRIIAGEVSDYLFTSEGSGPVQIVSARLSGKMDEVEHCDLPQNAHVLSVEVKLNKTRLRLPWNLPPFEDLKGTLFFKDGDLNLTEVTGKFFHSTLERAKGVFSRLLGLSTLHFSSQGDLDLRDLPALERIEGFSREPLFGGFRRMTGKAGYNLFFKAQLQSPIEFQHQGTYVLSGVQLEHPRIPVPLAVPEGTIEYGSDGGLWNGVRLVFGDSSFTMSGWWKKGAKGEPFGVSAKGRLDLKSLIAFVTSPSFPEAIRQRIAYVDILSGKGDFAFKGQGPDAFRFSSYEGEWTPKENQIQLKGTSSPLMLREGALFFSNSGLSFSKLKLQYRDLPLTIEGSVRDHRVSLLTTGSLDLSYLRSVLQSPLLSDILPSRPEEFRELRGEAGLRLRWSGRTDDGIQAIREGEVRLKGVALRHEQIPFLFSGVEGLFLLSPEHIRFEGLKGSLGDTFLAASGTVSRIGLLSGGSSTVPSPLRSLSFHVASPQVDLDTLFPGGEGSSSPSRPFLSRLGEWLSVWSLDGLIEVEKWRHRESVYRNVKVEMKTVEGRLMLRTFQLSWQGGDLWGEGWIESAERGVRFEIKPRVSNMEAKSFLRVLLQKERQERIDISGRIHISKVDLRGEGEDFQKVKASLNGSLKLALESGVIERWNILAKIFSVLNVSQILIGRLPDLKSKGLPFHQITANVLIKNGVATTEDLFVDSDAIRITLAGGVDLGKGIIDARIGVHPLVTVDTLLSKIPIVGYILTGNEKAFLSYYYEVKGDLDDPRVEAIPIKALGEGFLGFVKRLLETPLRPFQKTPGS